MDNIIDFGKLILIVLIFSTLIYSIDEWITHINQTKKYVDIYGYGNFKLFKKYFNRVNWERRYPFKWSLFYNDITNNIESKIHAGIFEFNNIGMIIKNPISFWITKLYTCNFIKTNFLKEEKKIKKRKIYKWE